MRGRALILPLRQCGRHELIVADRHQSSQELRERFEAFKRRDLYEIRVAALFLDAVFLSVRPDGPRRASWSLGGSPKRARGCGFR
jgi:hypothetical protein